MSKEEQVEALAKQYSAYLKKETYKFSQPMYLMPEEREKILQQKIDHIFAEDAKRIFMRGGFHTPMSLIYAYPDIFAKYGFEIRTTPVIENPKYQNIFYNGILIAGGGNRG